MENHSRGPYKVLNTHPATGFVEPLSVQQWDILACAAAYALYEYTYPEIDYP